MNRTRTTLCWLALAAALSTATACGSGSDAAPSTAVTPSAEAEAEAEADSGFGQAPEDATPEAPQSDGPQPDGPQPDGPEPDGQPEGPQDEGVPAAPAPEDCVSYNPSNLTVIASTGGTWTLRDGGHAIKVLATKSDADAAKAVARRWTQRCFIGRGNDREDRYRYIITYWKSPSGLPFEFAPTLDCITYDPSALSIYYGSPHPANPDQNDYALYAGATPLVFLDTEADALRAQLVAAANTRLCIIGHGNALPDPARYYLHTWR
jgi:hypothetical protein